MKRWFSFLPAILFYLLIFVLSSSAIPISLQLGRLDKIAHILEFGSLGFLLAVGFFNAFSFSPTVKSALTLGSGLILAILDEWHQLYVPLRIGDVLDIVADAAGLVLGIFLFRTLVGWKKRTPHEQK